MKEFGKCTHFNGIQNKVCRAGISYPHGKLPCFKSEGLLCDKYQEPSQDEVDDDKKRFQACLDRHAMAYTLITRLRKELKGKNWSGVEECPVCKGKLHLTHVAYNGHMSGRCETEDCLNWIE